MSESRDAAYGAMAKEVRADLHEHFAGWLARAAEARELDELKGNVVAAERVALLLSGS